MRPDIQIKKKPRKKVMEKFWSSFDSGPNGFSFRKLSSVVIMGCVIYIHYKYVSEQNAMTALLYDFGFICALLGLLNLDKFFELKFGRQKEENGEIDIDIVESTDEGTVVEEDQDGTVDNPEQ